MEPSLPFTIMVRRTGEQDLLLALRRPPAPWAWFLLRLEAEKLAAQPFPGLMALEYLRERWQKAGVIPYPHQIETARRVIQEMQGRAILADEVGLGKTIEAGLILKEYMLRGWVRRVLILTPAGLVRQWAFELQEKFDLRPHFPRTEADWESAELLLASLDMAKQERHARTILTQEYDLVIVDEAHRLKNARTRNWQFVHSLKTKYLLLLTATPVQNSLQELYNLITLLRPGQLGTYRQFKQRYMTDPRHPKNVQELKALLGEVMIRNRRSQGMVQLPRRHWHARPVLLSPEEDRLYRAVTDFIRRSWAWSAVPAQRLVLLTLQREVCSSAAATAETLATLGQRWHGETGREASRLAAWAATITASSKAEAVEEILRSTSDQVVIFTEFRASQRYLCQRLLAAGYRVVALEGRMPAGQREWARWLFQHQARVLVSTEAGGEGINLQFCHRVINFDLPWNPLRLEQRIGRVYRLGQTSEVHIHNLVSAGTIEEEILRILYEKMDMFTQVIGDPAELLGQVRSEPSLEIKILESYLEGGAEEFKAHLAALAQEVSRAWEEAFLSKEWWEE